MSGLDELDLHLAGEGRHERRDERLGADCLDEGGVRFAVWAPNARAVLLSATGTTAARAPTCLSPVGSSGTWEGVAPNATEGQR